MLELVCSYLNSDVLGCRLGSIWCLSNLFLNSDSKALSLMKSYGDGRIVKLLLEGLNSLKFDHNPDVRHRATLTLDEIATRNVKHVDQKS